MYPSSSLGNIDDNAVKMSVEMCSFVLYCLMHHGLYHGLNEPKVRLEEGFATQSDIYLFVSYPFVEVPSRFSDLVKKT